MVEAVGVAVDDALHALAPRVVPEPPVEVEAPRAGVQLNPGAGRGARVDDGLLVQRIRIPLQQEATGEVAEHVDVRVLRRADEALGVVSLVAARDVQTGHDHVELREQVVGEVEALLEDVHLRAGEQAEVGAAVGKFLVHGRDVGELLREALGGKAVRLKTRARMVGDGPVAQAQFLRVRGDLLQCLVAVAPVGVVVK